MENFQDPKPFKALEMAKSHEFLGASPTGPAGELRAPAEPQLLSAMAWGTQLTQRMATQNLTRKPDSLHASVVLEIFHKLWPV